MEKIFIGVDPGKTGAIAVVTKSMHGNVFDFEDRSGLMMLQEIQNRMVLENVTAMAAVEKVGAMPGQGVSSMFKFGNAFGIVQGWLEALAIPIALVTPTKWQKVVWDSGERTGDSKSDSLNLARRLFPCVLDRLARKKDHNRADALLIAEYCRRNYGDSGDG